MWIFNCIPCKPIWKRRRFRFCSNTNQPLRLIHINRMRKPKRISLFSAVIKNILKCYSHGVDYKTKQFALLFGFIFHFSSTQLSVLVGCVPSAAVAVFALGGGGVCSGGAWSGRGVCSQGGAWSGRGVCSQGGAWSGGVSAPGVCGIPTCTEADPPCGQNDRQV